MQSYTPNEGYSPSIQYTYDGFIKGLATFSRQDFGDNIKFMLWDADRIKYRYGLVNVAAFLANAMVEAIQYDSCDEPNWENVAGRHAISNACGQEGRSYQDETCGIYSCEVDANMEITGVTTSSIHDEGRAPPPFECRPVSDADPFTGYFDTNTGNEVADNPYANAAGRIDVEGKRHLCFMLFSNRNATDRLS